MERIDKNHPPKPHKVSDLIGGTNIRHDCRRDDESCRTPRTAQIRSIHRRNGNEKNAQKQSDRAVKDKIEEKKLRIWRFEALFQHGFN